MANAPIVENPHGISINMDQFTTNVVRQDESIPDKAIDANTVTGDGIFDILMVTATKHLEALFNAGRLRGEDYATSYLQLYQANLQAAVQIWLQKPIAELQKESEEAKKELYYRQIEGFDEDYKQKLLKIMMDAWAVGFSVARDNFIAAGTPGPMQKATIDDLYNRFIVTDLDSYSYGRKAETLNRGPTMDIDAVILESKNIINKLTAAR